MPTYEYVCEKCGFKFEKFQNMSDELLKKCPQCNGIIRRLIGKGAGIIFKGSEFHSTDGRDSSDRTCCGRTERCDKPPCSDDGVCKR